MKKKSILHLSQALGHEATDKRLDILRRIGELGSISEAARSASVSYKAAWQALETLSNLAGSPLLEKAVGGSGGGGARLTPAGVQLLEAAELLHQARARVLSQLEQSSSNTLSLSGLLGLELRTSMRNQLPCRIKAITKKLGMAQVQLELANGTTLISRITKESAELLGLRVGMPALALCKATAVTIGTGLQGPASMNLIHGQVLSATSAAAGSETSIALAPGVNLVGFCMETESLVEGHLAMAAVDESAVVIAIPG
jgi:molybdate transport system regulatory protein